jgi:site-specific recombinase XerD
VDIFAVARMLGHTGLRQAQKYAQVTDKLMRNAVAALPVIRV